MEYIFHYEDGKFFVLEMTEEDETELVRQICVHNKPFIKLSSGIVSTSGLRYAVRRVEEEEEELKSETPPEYAWEELMDKQKRRNFDDDDEGDVD